jgi:hypothetical protein
VGATSKPLLLTWAAPDPLLTLVRRLPLAGQVLSPPQVVRWWVVATYRVRLAALPANACPAPPCFGAVLLDAMA